MNMNMDLNMGLNEIQNGKGTNGGSAPKNADQP